MPGFSQNIATATTTTEPEHNKTYNKVCATSEDVDQPAHLRSLTSVFADRMSRLEPSG